jgi:integrase
VALTSLAVTGLRWSELVALRRRDLTLDGSAPRVRVRRGFVRGTFGPPKSRHGRRDVRLSPELIAELRRHVARRPADADALAFPSRPGTPLAYPNMLRRVLRPAAEEAGAAWAGFHTFRHTFASLHLARRTTVVQLQRLLGHHSPAFTLDRYAHLIPGDEAEPLDLGVELAGRSARCASARGRWPSSGGRTAGSAPARPGPHAPDGETGQNRKAHRDRRAQPQGGRIGPSAEDVRHRQQIGDHD